MFRRIGNLIRGFFGLFISGLERQNPEALLEVEKENLRKQISEYNKGLAAHAAMCERLISQVKREETEIRDLTAKTAAHLKAGNRKLAGEYALRLQKIKQGHTTNVEQLEAATRAPGAVHGDAGAGQHVEVAQHGPRGHPHPGGQLVRGEPSAVLEDQQQAQQSPGAHGWVPLISAILSEFMTHGVR